ncbi:MULTISPECIES: AraC family transcriptional regulator [unclassified Treponema]|uniref:helix-turn-helix transcriptional regulator n=1 Tax=unclassified Treponema TaxID=2638727 RepID=UPI0020A48D5D|nr:MULTISPECIES: AraC family transcriptional regulator [unclassified Treponema]UTC67309.1 helix-turn-helix transcriptional regulator [Treponema sp. OMZ 789]UTC70037.1 helix-turn-helix transcriptional regulator [Treponema sp. OMZ 790]UTC72753.1 helix-turn-helix transcriptional regulator [Treponema sp. OMZ 791]
MRSLEEHWNDLERLGFTRAEDRGTIRYEVPPKLGKGAVTILGDFDRALVSIADLEFFESITLLENVNEKTVSIGQFYEGELDIYEKDSSELLPCEHGLNAFVNNAYFSGFKRFSAGVRLVNVGFVFRQLFFDEMEDKIGCKLPEDFWETSAKILNPGVLYVPQITEICNQVKDCRLEGFALNMFIRAKCFEVFSILFDYVYANKKKSAVYLSDSDIKALDGIRKLLETEMLSPPSIKELSKRFGINQQKLMLGFKERYNMTVYSYVKRLKMEKALQLLRDENLLIGDIARLSGYKGEGHFQQVFREVYGLTPHKMRKELFK